MPAPTAVKPTAAIQDGAAVTPVADGSSSMTVEANQTEDFMLDTTDQTLPAAGDIAAPTEENTEMAVDEESRPRFAAAKDVGPSVMKETRKVPIPPHRMTPLKKDWTQIYEALVEHLKLQVRVNTRTKAVELRTSEHTTEAGSLQKGEDFVKAYTLGFEVQDAIALIRVPELYIQTFEIKDVKSLTGDHLARGVGRIAGKDGKTKFAIENASRTRIVLADSKIHILGSFRNVRMAQESIVDLILGKPPSKVYGNLRTISARQKERF
ncbi:hypothetical protein PpBr36_03507 [Pyricularia pennisetigena]|uniref:hypothetical protein n=1 Tax=Pyricularia pennisetigena TaxID=1578925 RepID=UPI001154AA33|nr:hypothetical protein PpBr36_03507 [Pyricularia pennisetigena]TLS30642.1 hypothetical protein PpBr36_03507 [Pyricularia pennisetigena]